MQTNEPNVSYNQLLAIAKASGLIGTYSTEKLNDAVVRYGRAILRDRVIQEAFVRANQHQQEVPQKGRYTCKPNLCYCHPETCCCSDYVVLTPDGDVLMKTNKGPEIVARLNGECPK